MKKIIKTITILMGSLMLVVSCANPTDTVIDEETTVIVDTDDKTTDDTTEDEPTEVDTDDKTTDDTTEDEPTVVKSLVLIEDFNESSIWVYDYKFVLTDGRETIVHNNLTDTDKSDPYIKKIWVLGFDIPDTYNDGRCRIRKTDDNKLVAEYVSGGYNLISSSITDNVITITIEKV